MAKEGYRIVKVTGEFLVCMAMTGASTRSDDGSYVVVSQGLPDDAEVCNVSMVYAGPGEMGCVVCFVVWSRMWEDGEDGDEFNVIFGRVRYNGNAINNNVEI